MKNLKFIHLFIVIILTYSGQTHSYIEFEDAIFPELAISGRATAMGSAFISKVDDSSAAFYNPAGLGTVRKTHFHMSNFHLESNKGWIDSSAGGKVSGMGTTITNGFNVDGIRQNLLKSRGKLSHFRAQAMPNFTTRYFSLGYLYSKQIRGTIGQQATALYEYAVREDHGPYAALNISLFGGVIKFGASAILLNRKEKIDQVDRNTEVTLESSDYRKGSAVISTGGFKLTFPVTFLPTFSVNIHNLASQDFSGRAMGPPGKIRQTIDTGFSITPQIGKVTRVHFEINYKDIGGNYSDVSINRKILMGMELDLARIMFIRLGYGDGFGCAGLGVKFQELEFDLTSYAVDTTSNEFRGAEDRRFSMSFSFGF